jgi:hypothetical protein
MNTSDSAQGDVVIKPKRITQMSVYMRMFGAFTFFVFFWVAPIATIFLVLTIVGVFPASGSIACVNGECTHEPGPSNMILWGSIAICFAVVTIPGMILMGRNAVKTARLMPIPGLVELISPLLPPAPLLSPAPVEQIWSVLDRFNQIDLPYTLSREEDKGSTVIVVRWREESAEWRTIVGKGGMKQGWAMRVRLDPSGHDRFSERTSRSSRSVQRTGASFHGSISWGKTLALMSATKVYSPGLKKVDGKPTTRRSVKLRIVPSDAKIPIFRVLRAYGWRPRWDIWFSEMLEY